MVILHVPRTGPWEVGLWSHLFGHVLCAVVHLTVCTGEVGGATCGACLGTAGWSLFLAKLTFWAGQQPLASGFSLPGSGCPRGPLEELLSKYPARFVCVHGVCVLAHVCICVHVGGCACMCTCVRVLTCVPCLFAPWPSVSFPLWCGLQRSRTLPYLLT